MKTMLFAFCFFCATAAFGQTAGAGALLNSEPMVVEFTSHAARASRMPMGVQQNLLEGSNVTSAHGDGPCGSSRRQRRLHRLAIQHPC